MTLQSLNLNKLNQLTNCPTLPESILQANRDELDLKLNITKEGEQELPQDGRRDSGSVAVPRCLLVSVPDTCASSRRAPSRCA